MSELSHLLQHNLKKFLLDLFEHSDSPHHQAKFRYSNLKLHIEPGIDAPHFCVNIGSSDACFSLENMTKIKGHIGSDERYIIRWASRPGIKTMLDEFWQSAPSCEKPVLTDEPQVQEEETRPPKPEEPEQIKPMLQVRKRFQGFADLYRSIQ